MIDVERGYESFGHALVKFVKLMNILHLL